jgi:GNAT superfamily N-acetyltransferase
MAPPRAGASSALPTGYQRRQYHSADAEAASRLHAMVFPVSEGTLDRQLSEVDDSAIVQVVTHGDDVVALLEVRRRGAERMGLRLVVEPGFRGRGLGRGLLNVAIRAADTSCPGGLLRTAVNDQDQPSLEWAQRRGFEPVSHSIGLSRQLSDPSGRLRESARTAAQAAGVDIRPFTADPDAGDWDWLTELLADCSAGMRDSGAGPVTEAVTRYLVPWPEGVLVAWQDHRPVGLVSIAPEEAGTLYCWFTGVRPEQRQTGVAVALKLAAAVLAQANGASALRTNNDEENTPMLRLNLGLGYRRTTGVRWLHRPCNDPTHETKPHQ